VRVLHPGMLLSAKALLDRVPRPAVSEIEEALSGNLCRCTGYAKILKAVQRAAELLTGTGAGRGDGTSRRGREAGR